MGKAFKLRNGSLLIIVEAPGGIYNSEQLKQIAYMSDNDSAIVKVTEDQRLALFISEDKVDDVVSELKNVGLGVRDYKNGLHQPTTCIGELCPDYQQDALGCSLKLTEELSKVELKNPLKIGINGCSQCCVPCHTLDISLIGDENGYRFSLGGKGSQFPEIATFIAEAVPENEVPAFISKIIESYNKHAEGEESLQDVMERIGVSEFADLLKPYSQDAAGVPDELMSGLGGDVEASDLSKVPDQQDLQDTELEQFSEDTLSDDDELESIDSLTDEDIELDSEEQSDSFDTDDINLESPLEDLEEGTHQSENVNESDLEAIEGDEFEEDKNQLSETEGSNLEESASEEFDLPVDLESDELENEHAEEEISDAQLEELSDLEIEESGVSDSSDSLDDDFEVDTSNDVEEISMLDETLSSRLKEDNIEDISSDIELDSERIEIDSDDIELDEINEEIVSEADDDTVGLSEDKNHELDINIEDLEEADHELNQSDLDSSQQSLNTEEDLDEFEENEFDEISDDAILNNLEEDNTDDEISEDLHLEEDNTDDIISEDLNLEEDDTDDVISEDLNLEKDNTNDVISEDLNLEEDNTDDVISEDLSLEEDSSEEVLTDDLQIESEQTVDEIDIEIDDFDSKSEEQLLEVITNNIAEASELYEPDSNQESRHNMLFSIENSEKVDFSEGNKSLDKSSSNNHNMKFEGMELSDDGTIVLSFAKGFKFKFFPELAAGEVKVLTFGSQSIKVTKDQNNSITVELADSNSNLCQDVA